jgi:hypothetical protein
MLIASRSRACIVSRRISLLMAISAAAPQATSSHAINPHRFRSGLQARPILIKIFQIDADFAD